MVIIYLSKRIHNWVLFWTQLYEVLPGKHCINSMDVCILAMSIADFGQKHYDSYNKLII